MTFIFNPIPSMGQHFTLGAGPAQIMGQHVLPRLYGCRRLCPWVNDIRYLGICIVLHTSFRCSTDHAKRSFYRAANAIFAKAGRFASEEVILELIV